MTNNISVTQGTGTTIATDDVAGVQYQRVKINDGTEDGTNALKVDSGGSMQAAIASLPAIPSGTNAIGTMILTSLPVLPTGTNIIGAVKRDVVNYTPVSKYVTASYVSETTVWTPAGGKKFNITDLIISASAAGTCTLRDGLGGSTIMEFTFAANGGVTSNFQTPIVSASADNKLTIQASAAAQRITVAGYEV